MRIQNNIAAVNTHRQLSINTGSQAKSVERLSSGFRINRAADDAAGLAISEKMRTQIRGLNQGSRNTQDGISLIQTAEGALQVASNILQRMRELAVQSANGTNAMLDRAALDLEFQQLKEELDQIAHTTQFNGKILLDGRYANPHSPLAKIGVSASMATVLAESIPYNVLAEPSFYVLESSPLEAVSPVSAHITAMSAEVIDFNNLVNGSSGTGWSFNGGILTIIGDGNFQINGTGVETSNRIVVESGREAVLTLHDVNISTSAGAALNTSGATALLNLTGANTLTSTRDISTSGIQATNGVLTIDGSGSLTANGTASGIGGDAGTIVINGGTITTQGIRSGISGVGGDIIITGGTINAIGHNGAGIGGFGIGSSNVGNITITGGTVTATANLGGAGIGGAGGGGDGGNIFIGGNATVNAYGGMHSGAGIGSGWGRDIISNGGNITIGGNAIVNASASSVGGTGIGGNDANITINGNATVTADSEGTAIGSLEGNATVIINGGTVNAVGGLTAIGVASPDGAPNFNQGSATIIINGGTVNAESTYTGFGSVGIGGGIDYNITINGGTVNSNGTIGGGLYETVNRGVVNINGGTVTAYGGRGSAGIGGISRSTGGTINIRGGRVDAHGGNNGAGIGSGDNIASSPISAVHSGGYINIMGGIVTASGDGNAAAVGGGGSIGGVASHAASKGAELFISGGLLEIAPGGWIGGGGFGIAWNTAAENGTTTIIGGNLSIDDPANNIRGGPTDGDVPVWRTMIIESIDFGVHRPVTLWANGNTWGAITDSNGNLFLYIPEDIVDEETEVFILYNGIFYLGTVAVEDNHDNVIAFEETARRPPLQPGQEGALWIQTGANSGDGMFIYIDSMSVADLGIGDNHIRTQDAATDSISAMTAAINRVSMQRADLGASQNRLEFTVANVDNSAENLAAAESRIRDVDMAKKMATFTKEQILIQASTAMLVQANAIPQGVLQLLG